MSEKVKVAAGHLEKKGKAKAAPEVALLPNVRVKEKDPVRVPIHPRVGNREKATDEKAVQDGNLVHKGLVVHFFLEYQTRPNVVSLGQAHVRHQTGNAKIGIHLGANFTGQRQDVTLVKIATLRTF